MYKLRHRILPTKDVLLKKGVVKELACTLCYVNNETHEHIFIYCTHTWEAWIFVERLLRKYTGNKHYYLNDSESFETIYTRNNALCFTINEDVNFDY